MPTRLSPDLAWPAPALGRYAAKGRQRAPLRVVVAEAWRRWRTRQMLGELDARMLKDIGASPADAREEAGKPFWRV
ncbi:MAG: DUF1127 domain-containing protein [Alphaproteobacteria bacterium]|nr:DUF1127 domain-containing protein [Alphaproteobacteria bacterium]